MRGTVEQRLISYTVFRKNNISYQLIFTICTNTCVAKTLVTATESKSDCLSSPITKNGHFGQREHE